MATLGDSHRNRLAVLALRFAGLLDVVSNAIKVVGGSLVPPGIDPTLWWRLVVSTSVFGLILFSVWAVGLTGSGFARASDVDKVRRHQLEQRLDNVHALICMEGRVVDPQLVELARLLEREYREVNEEQPYQVNCNLLLKLRQ